MSFIPIILHGAAWWGWVPRDPGWGFLSCPWWLSLSTGSPLVMVFRGDQGVGLKACPQLMQVPKCGWLLVGSMTCPPPCPHPAGAGEAELQPQEGEWDPRGALRAGQSHESRDPGKGTGGPCWACHPLGLVTHLPLSSAVPQITVDMELSVSGLEDMGDAITFHLQLRR